MHLTMYMNLHLKKKNVPTLTLDAQLDELT